MGSVNRFGQKTGRETRNWSRREKPESIELNGLWCQIRPLRTDDAETLFHEWYSIDDDRDWTYLSHNKPQSILQCIDYFKKLSECSHSIHLAVTDKNDNLVKGIFSVDNIDCDNGVFELADVNWTPQMKRTRVSTESIYLVLSLFFNKLGYRRCEWRTNIYNEDAIKSAIRLGFTHEGILRDKKITKGYSEDISVFSVTSGDWPGINDALIAWLRKENFDERGRQIRHLSDFYLP
ncbi:TPA: GNAT family N-acetyltransferase [Escherichia coli]|nr:GNAT family N-acetyltransferase [Escherichia coli]